MVWRLLVAVSPSVTLCLYSTNVAIVHICSFNHVLVGLSVPCLPMMKNVFMKHLVFLLRKKAVTSLQYTRKQDRDAHLHCAGTGENRLLYLTGQASGTQQ